jgi:hypothetical protein
MKTWIFVYEMSHESFSGHTHRDGEVRLSSSGRTYESAYRKVTRQVEKECRGTSKEARLKFVETV